MGPFSGQPHCFTFISDLAGSNCSAAVAYFPDFTRSGVCLALRALIGSLWSVSLTGVT